MSRYSRCAVRVWQQLGVLAVGTELSVGRDLAHLDPAELPAEG